MESRPRRLGKRSGDLWKDGARHTCMHPLHAHGQRMRNNGMALLPRQPGAPVVAFLLVCQVLLAVAMRPRLLVHCNTGVRHEGWQRLPVQARMAMRHAMPPKEPTHAAHAQCKHPTLAEPVAAAIMPTAKH